MRAFRIADRRHPVFDGTGARLIGGRWNSPGRAVIYAAETFAGALLEVLVHANLGRVPQTHAVIEISIPESISIETAYPQQIPGWDTPDQIASREFGDRWLREGRSAILLVPSLAAGGRERNVLINPEHSDFRRITASEPEDVRWDDRLFHR
jgi:RES domain-containing protein